MQICSSVSEFFLKTNWISDIVLRPCFLVAKGLVERVLVAVCSGVGFVLVLVLARLVLVLTRFVLALDRFVCWQQL